MALPVLHEWVEAWTTLRQAINSTALSWFVFAAVLNEDDSRRAGDVVTRLFAHGLRGALTGGLAIEAQLALHGRPVERRPLNDVDFVVESFASIPQSIAGQFLLNHIHPFAPEGKTLLQVIDEDRALRVDLFKAFGRTLSRSVGLSGDADSLRVVSVEDLAARTTSYVCGRLRSGRAIDVKHARAFARLQGIGRPRHLEVAWQDHRQDVPGSFEDAAREAAHLLACHPELVVVEEYAKAATHCDQCRNYGSFHRAGADRIMDILGYC